MHVTPSRPATRRVLRIAFQDQRLSAVTYARQHLAPWAPQHMAELQRALATLALTASTKVAPYKALFSEQQWTALLDLFYKELYRLHNLLPESQLEIHLQVCADCSSSGSVWQITHSHRALPPMYCICVVAGIIVSMPLSASMLCAHLPIIDNEVTTSSINVVTGVGRHLS